jgi:PERQ amino acid-rich with GYF domain-containing protein
LSPTAGGSRFFRDEPNTTTPPPSLLRRKTDFRDPSLNIKTEDKDRSKEGTTREHAPDISSPFGSLKRSTTNPLSAGLTGPTSPWPSASQNASFSPMGAFGSFSLGPTNPQTTSTEKRPGFGSVRGESRFKGLLSKDSSEDVDASAKERSSQRSTEKLSENESGSRSQSPWGERVKTRATRSETNPFEEEHRSGSAALGGSQEVGASPPGIDQLGFSAFGMTSDVPGLRELLQSRDNTSDSPAHLHGLEPTSPTNTNPYQSPRGDKVDDDVETDGSDVQRTHLPGLSELRDDTSTGAFGSIRRGGSGLDLSTGDRSQTSSAGPGRSFSSLGGLGGISGLGGPGGWPPTGPIGTPTRERQAFSGFGDPIFGSMAEIQSPSLSTLGGGGFFGPHSGLSGSGSIGRAGKMGSLFPPAMQEQMQAEQARQDSGGIEGGSRQPGKNKLSSRGVSTEGAGLIQISRSDVSSQMNPPSLPTTSSAGLTTPLATSGEGSQSAQTPSAGNPGSNTMPAAQQRTMVMPDRMRWIYRDPQGNIQGPWSGLEMHDWFKAGFFTAELQVKKLEDPEFEPLAQLVRRIGNSREPFLVPQIGIPHGPDPSAPSAWGQASQPGTAQPPFANSFPTFGTTLTAEQQNALERRKQEEQYLMARQKEHLAQQQALMKQMQLQGGPHHPHPLQHHSSAHSLHSQPSYGSITSPAGGYQPSPVQGPIQPPQAMPGYFDASLRQNPLPGLGPQVLGTGLMGSQDELPALLDRLNVNRPDPFAFNPSTSFGARQQDLQAHQVATMLQDRARLQQEQEQYDKAHPENIFDQQARDERLRQFHALRSEDEEVGIRGSEGLPTHPASTVAQDERMKAPAEDELAVEQTTSVTHNEPLSLSQQVQKAASRQQQQQQQKQAQAEAAWVAKGDSGIPHPFPPPPSASPLPAPAAQRNRQNVADALAATSRSQTQTPVETPSTSIAPWAKDTVEAPKGPSLKEIQEAEARSAAQREEMAAAARRAQLLAEQERLSQAQASAPGLPSTANWASAGSPVTPGSTGSVWSKPLPGGKGAAVPANAPAKKTLAQIQKEEEARKQRLAAAAAANAVQATGAPAAPASAAKRYADLASKPAAQPAPGPGSAWTTVGAGGKTKAPPAAPTGPRSTSATVAVPQVAKPRPVAPTRTVTVGSTPPANPNRATEELAKWAKMSLSRGLNSSINGKIPEERICAGW